MGGSRKNPDDDSMSPEFIDEMQDLVDKGIFVLDGDISSPDTHVYEGPSFEAYREQGNGSAATS